MLYFVQLLNKRETRTMLYMGVIGCGNHAKYHTRQYGGFFLTYGVWDPSPEAMQKFGGKKYPTLGQLLDDSNTQAVMICSPDEFHLTQIEMALAAGKHVLCEKPLMVPGEDMARLEAAFDLAEKKKLVLTSCHPRRFDRPVLWLKDQVRPRSDQVGLVERFGRVMSFDFDFSYHAPSHDWKHDRSLLLDHLNHEVDLMNALFGIQGFDAWKLHDSFNRYDVVGKRDDGITFHLRGTRRLAAHVYPEWCRVRFERGEVELDMMMGLAYVRDHERKVVETVPGLAIDYDGRLEKVMADFGDVQIFWNQRGYLSRAEMLMNTEAGIALQNEGVQRINIRS